MKLHELQKKILLHKVDGIYTIPSGMSYPVKMRKASSEREFRMGTGLSLGACEQVHPFFGKLDHQHDFCFSTARVEKLQASTDVECDICLLLCKVPSAQCFQMTDIENVIVSSASLQPSSIVQGSNLYTTIFCPSSKIVFLVLAWHLAAQFFLMCQKQWICYSVFVTSWS